METIKTIRFPILISHCTELSFKSIILFLGFQITYVCHENIALFIIILLHTRLELFGVIIQEEK
jgi:hypothetical protein